MSAPSAKPSAAHADPPKPQSQRYVPGAGGLASKKPKKKKVDTTKTAGDANGHGISTSTINGDTPVALLSKAPSSSELPAELLAEKGEIERELKEDAAAIAASGGHEKGPIGEAVSRRMKVLTKKIQRFRAYMEKPEASLNPDQKAAIATLPALEGGLRELEDIAKSVETIEHEHRNSARTELENAKMEAVEVYKRETLPLLSTIISVHSALHPASISSSTSFIPIDLPPHLQEISSQDVNAVDDMYERLRNGGKEGVEVVLTLVKGLEGTQLHALLTGARISSSTVPSADQPEDSTPVFSPAAQDETLPETSETNPPASLSFIQQTTATDETETPAGAEMGAFEQGPEIADIAPKEVVPAPAANGAEGMSFMQTSELAMQQNNDHSQVQQGAHEGGPGMGMENAFNASEDVENVPAPSVAQLDAQAFSAQQPSSFNWADAEDSHHVPETFSLPSGTEAPLASAPAPAATEDTSANPTAIAPPLAIEATSDVHPAQAQGGHRGGRGGRGGPRGGFRGGPRGGFRRHGHGNGPADSNAENNKGNKTGTAPPTGQPMQTDSDGFQVAGRRRPPPGAPGFGGQGGSFRGRGRGFPGGPGGNGEGGRGRGSFRGRGGAAKGRK
ncbi:hypothetical protein QFC19_002690 [Naganishia cerealis]|uniref:Uncharacterized protein n=1 Tax=Naganishia cerealis TaxID=610337 RepID=A0ACC2W8H7_9TREE|nr:hypothetical protein QFC19_002690 [Naganishia cerealis]